jgi:hypothetical protein
MNFEQTVTLIGFVGKKGNGRLDNGQEWSTDRVELHCLSEFPKSESMAHGQTVIVYNVEDYALNFDKAKFCLDQKIVLQMMMSPSKKLGSPPKMICTGFELPNLNSNKKNNSTINNPI